MGHKCVIAGSRESSQDPGGSKQKTSILLNRSCARKIFEKTSPSCLFRCYLLEQTDRDRRMLWAGHCIAWRGNPACLALWLLLCLQITHYMHQSHLILRPALGTFCSPGGSKGQLFIRLKQIQSSPIICTGLCSKLGFSRRSCLKMGNVSGYSICIYTP